MARHTSKPIIRTSYYIKSSTTTNKTTTSSNTSSSSNISNTNYNDILAKLNNYALKTDLNDYTKNSALSDYVKNSVLSDYVKSSDLVNNSGNVNDAALAALIQKLKDYDIFKYDTDNKQVIVTEFFPHLTAQQTGNYTNGIMPYVFPDNWQMLIVMAQTEGNSVNNFDFVYIQTPNGNKTVNNLSLAKYFKSGLDADGHKCLKIDAAILNEPITIVTRNNIKSIKIFWAWDELRIAANYQSTNPSDELLVNGPTEMFVEFMPATTGTKNGITCEFNGGSSGTSGYLAGGIITLTLPETVSLINNSSNGSWPITLNGNVIKIKLISDDGSLYYGAFKKQIIIAESATKRYVIKLNGEAFALPPNY